MIWCREKLPKKISPIFPFTFHSQELLLAPSYTFLHLHGVVKYYLILNKKKTYNTIYLFSSALSPCTKNPIIQNLTAEM